MESGTRLTLAIDKPAAGGSMIARSEGRVLLVAGAIPGEVVEAVVDRVQRGTVWASVTRVLERSADRVEPAIDETCGGSVFAHIRYERQLALKRDIVRDAFARLGRLPLDGPLEVAASPVAGYRLRARLHVERGRVGFYREGTHELCDPRSSGQLRDDTLGVIDRLEGAVRSVPQAKVTAIELSENIVASERACHLELARDGDPSRLGAASQMSELRGVSSGSGYDSRPLTLWGQPEVVDEIEVINGGGAVLSAKLVRHARSFFQGNRFLVSTLATRVGDLVPNGRMIDLYAGVGLFAVTRAARGGVEVTAVEGDRAAADDLRRNADLTGHVTVHRQAVEHLPASLPHPTSTTVVVDPPRTGLSTAARRLLVGWQAARLVYVSCDVATLARDARTLVDAGYTISSVEAFDLFPNTAHVETLVVFDRAGGPGGPGRAGWIR
ncbi:MAG: class I SAM-dependent RNA methyltransferase [Vicinamibacterales bacterium]